MPAPVLRNSIAMEDGNAGIQNLMTDESIWIPASAGMTKDAIHPRAQLTCYTRAFWLFHVTMFPSRRDFFQTFQAEPLALPGKTSTWSNLLDMST
jgi:hypothetical protein